MDQENLNHYFGNIWWQSEEKRMLQSRFDRYTYSGLALLDKVGPDETVLDVGCGPHHFKGKIKNIVGVDPGFDVADYKMTIEDFSKISNQKFDVAFCLGSVNFGSQKRIIKQIRAVVDLLNPSARIYWRCNPGHKDHPNLECEEIDFFPWVLEHHEVYSKYFGFECPVLCWDSNNRIYAEWIRTA